MSVFPGVSSPGSIGKGVLQGCILSPYLFSFYAEQKKKDTDL